MKNLSQQTPPDLAHWLERVEALRNAPEWPAAEQPIELKQTHISVVLLGQQRVLKLKKPVNFGFLDYTTLEQRLQACEAEIQLNRRLCPDVYLGLGCIREVAGQLTLADRAGQIVDYGVWMKRLPAERMLDVMVRRDEVPETLLERIAGRLADFHRTVRRGADVNVYGSRETLRQNWAENFAQTEPYVGRTISAAAWAAVREWVTDWLEHAADLLVARQAGGWVCEGHGDVRCESVCVTDEIYIYDCIEFNERFRCGDVASEVAFLAMDLAALGRPDLGYFFCECYQAHSQDSQLFQLLPFYCCYRAYVRGKVLSFRLAEAEFGAAAQAEASARAQHYFELARRFAAPLQAPTVIAVTGFSGTGKTAVARALASELGLRVVSADAVRHDLYGEAKQPAAYGAGVYTAEAHRRTYQALFERGGEMLKQAGGVILDATFLRAADRAAARDLALARGAHFRWLECQLTPELVQARLARRVTRQQGAPGKQSDASWEIYQQQRRAFEPLAEASPDWFLPLDTNGDLAAVGRTAADWLRQLDSSA
jgi:aminoglycoside phosphotransferase family enzyme/predicted kinase